VNRVTVDEPQGLSTTAQTTDEASGNTAKTPAFSGDALDAAGNVAGELSSPKKSVKIVARTANIPLRLTVRTDESKVVTA
jgi:hypothetical protein